MTPPATSRINMRQLEKQLMQLKAIPQTDPRYDKAQELLAKGTMQYKQLALTQATERLQANQGDITEQPTVNVPQAVAAGFLGGNEIDPMNKGAAAAAANAGIGKSINKTLNQREIARDAAFQQHPIAEVAGEMLPDVLTSLQTLSALPTLQRHIIANKEAAKAFVKTLTGQTGLPPLPPTAGSSTVAKITAQKTADELRVINALMKTGASRKAAEAAVASLKALKQGPPAP